jgi:signal transduction histidine kinase
LGNKIIFSLEDNGRGCPNINKGFGLSSMEERVREVGGKIYFSSEVEEGFSINIEFKRDEL